MKLQINMRQAKKLERELELFSKVAVPKAQRDTLNRTAFNTQAAARRGIASSMTLRNKHTERSIRVKRTSSLTPGRMAARIGSTELYMRTQEFGGLKRKSGKRGVPLATTSTSGEGRNAKIRKRLPRGKRKLRKIQLRNKRFAGVTSKKQELYLKIKDAIESGRRMFYHDFGRGGSEGIFMVKGGSKRNKNNGVSSARIIMLYNLSKTTVRIPKKPWLKPPTLAMAKKMPAEHVRSLKFQAKRLGVLQNRR